MLHAKVALKGQAGEYTRRLRAVRLGLCVRALRAVPEGNASRLGLALAVFEVAVTRPLADVFLPIGRQLVADLDAVPTRDRALIAGRVAWRRIVAELERFPAIDRPCERLDEWRASGWDPAKAPPALDDALDAVQGDADATADGLQIAARRLRLLGVSPGAALRFTGEGFFEALGDPMPSPDLDR